MRTLFEERGHPRRRMEPARPAYRAQDGPRSRRPRRPPPRAAKLRPRPSPRRLRAKSRGEGARRQSRRGDEAEAAAGQAPEPADKPEPAHKPLEGELAHIARYDAAIASVRDLAVSSEEAASLRAALKAASEGDLQDARAARDKVSDPAARKLVDWYLYRAGFGTAARGSCLPGRQPGLARSAPADPALRGGAVQQLGERRRDQGLLRRQGAGDGGRPRCTCLGLSRRQGRGARQGAGGQGLDRISPAGRTGGRVPQALRLPPHRG